MRAVPPTTFRPRGESASRCLDVNGANSAHGTITSVQTGLCLNATGPASNAAVHVAACDNTAGRRWARA